MAKKQLADLIKEEVSKATDGDSDGAIAPTESSPSGTDSSDTAQRNGSSPATEATKRKRSPTKADLEAAVAQLTLQLDKAQATETNHQSQMAQMAQDFEQQINQLTTELAEAKSTILKLVDNNANAKSLQSQIQSLQAELGQAKEKVAALQQDVQQVDALKTELKKAQKRIAQLSPPTPTSKLASSRPAAKPLRTASRPTALSLRKSANSPQMPPSDSTRPDKFLSTESKFNRMRKGSIGQKQPISKLSDNEIGWFD